jgi:hypothetical protein
MRKLKTLFILSITLISCNTKTRNYENLILGDWEKVIEKFEISEKNEIIKLPPRQNRNGNIGYYFAENGVFENKLGYFGKNKEDNDGRKRNQFLGTQTKYKIVDDSLETYDLTSNKWENVKIDKLTKDSLILEYKDKSKEKFTKRNYNTSKVRSFDKIIVSTSGCYGSCPVTDIIISKSGEIIYNAEMYVNKKGLFKSKISKEYFFKIETDFKKANYINLKDEYIANHTDDMTLTITFIENNQIIKTITDYGRESPTELKWAVLPIIFLNQKIRLEQFENSKSYIDFGSGDFEKGNKICEITKSECFYLSNLLQNCKEENVKFKSKYIIRYWSNDNKKKVETDGQYYKFQIEKDKFITLNLGFNFLEKNNLLKRLRNKTEYE